MVMNTTALKDTFYSLVAPDLPNEWDVDEAIDQLTSIDEERCQRILNQVPVIWPVSHSLCFDYLKNAGDALNCITSNTLSEWVNKTLDQYEKNGLRAAQRYMADVEANFLCPLRGENGIPFKDVKGRLLPYLRGLSGMDLDLVVADRVYTDTATIFLPRRINRFNDDADNFFLYKLIVSYQWAFIAQSTYTVQPDHGAMQFSREDEEIRELWLPRFFRSFPCPELAADLYHFLETRRIMHFLECELPGLMRRKRELLFNNGENITQSTAEGLTLHHLQDVYLEGQHPGASLTHEPQLRELIEKHGREAATACDSLQTTSAIYPFVHRESATYIPVNPLPYQGSMHLEAVQGARNRRLGELKELFIDNLATQLMVRPDSEKKSKAGREDQGNSAADPENSGKAMVVDSAPSCSIEHDSETMLVTIDNETVELDPELQEVARNIINELGFLPPRYISSAAGKAGTGYGLFRGTASSVGTERVAPVCYDEWDYRRADFRKNWVNVLEKEIPLIHTNFVSDTLNRYHGQVVRLRYQFEMMRTTERFVRRQRDGEDIDLDAMVESLADSRAGLSPSDRLFVRLKRDERDIAVLFLIDMSNSTQGWIGKAIKETLVLLCEALEVVGDRYGIFGFSGMRRLRSEFFHIKHLDEPYDDQVRQRIGSIAPREYTRMGPALRHATSLLRSRDARTRLLITLTDGKPEDYDDYKGEYAVEDTRHALFEAKGAGIHPFCITVDQQAQDYMAHMYGEVNYIMIDSVHKLPRKMPEIYRVLTR